MPTDLEARVSRLAADLDDDPEALRRAVALLTRRTTSLELARMLDSWGLSAADLGRMFGVSRQAAARWVPDGVPPDRAADVGALVAADAVLRRFVEPDRIAAVVRRHPADGSPSLLELAEDGRFTQVHDEAQATFDVRRVQP